MWNTTKYQDEKKNNENDKIEFESFASPLKIFSLG